MNTESNIWRRLTPDTIAELPEAAAVFEVANLVRTIQYIGAAHGNLRQSVASWAQEQAKPMAVSGGYYVRYEPAAIEDELLAARLAAYRARHSGLAPICNRERATPLRVVARRAA